MRSQAPGALRRGRYVATCSEEFCRGQTAGGTSSLERGIFDVLNFILGGGSHDVPVPRDHRVRADMIFRADSGFTFAVEYDGAFWHRDHLGRDLRRTDLLRDLGVHEVMRIRESPLDATSALDVCVARNPDVQLCVQATLAHLLHMVSPCFGSGTIRRIEHALTASSKSGQIGITCAQCRKVVKAVTRCP